MSVIKEVQSENRDVNMHCKTISDDSNQGRKFNTITTTQAGKTFFYALFYESSSEQKE